MNTECATEFEKLFNKIPPRRQEVLLNLLKGLTDDEIASAMDIRPGTVRKQISTLCDDFNLKEASDERRSKRADLVALVARFKPEWLKFKSTNLNSEKAQLSSTSSIIESNIPTHPFSPLSGSVDNPQQFFDREREIRRIFELLNSGSSVALIGEAGIGKSSILQAIRQQAKTQLNPSRQPIYLDLAHVLDEDDFYLALCDQVGIEEQKGYRLSRTLKKHRLLLILDNVEKMAWDAFTNQVRSQIRALATDGNPPLRLVITARNPLDKLFTNGSMVSPFENICQEEMINRWDQETCRDFIYSRLQPTSIQFSEDEMTELIESSKGHPQQLMRLCYELYNRY